MSQKSCSYSFTGPEGQRVVLRGQAAIKAWLVAGGLEYLRGAANDARASKARDITETPEFKKWFGGSKVVDADGKPLVVYHGTKASFSQFRTPAWFTPSEEMADGFSAELGNGERTTDSKVMPVYLRIENPLMSDDWGVTEPNAAMLRQYKAWERDGHDGIIFTSEDGEVEYIAFRPEQIKSAIGNSGEFNPQNPDIRRSAERGLWYSQLSRAIESVPARLDNQSGVMWAQWLKANASKLGVKQDEITWSGIEEFLKLKGKAKVSKDEIGAYLAEGGVRLEEVVLGREEGEMYVDQDGNGYAILSDAGAVVRRFDREADAIREMEKMRSDGGTKYAKYTLPGGTNYREVLLTLPEPKLADIEPWTPGRMKAKRDVFIDAGFTPLGVDVAIAAAFEAGGVEAALRSLDAKVGSGVYKESQKEARDILRSAVSGERKNKEKRLEALSKASYKSNHWDTKNVLAHVRLNDRIDSSGRKTLFVEELQSDFGADTRKQRSAIEKAVDKGFEAIVERMKKAGVLEVVCD